MAAKRPKEISPKTAKKIRDVQDALPQLLKTSEALRRVTEQVLKAENGFYTHIKVQGPKTIINPAL